VDPGRVRRLFSEREHLSGGSFRQRPPTALETWRKPVRALDLKPIRTSPTSPADQPGRPNGSSNHPGGWAYVIAYKHRMNATAGYPAIWDL